MPILDDILDHDLLGTEFRKGELKGRALSSFGMSRRAG